MCVAGGGGSSGRKAASLRAGGVAQRGVAREYTTRSQETTFRAGTAFGKKQTVNLPGQGIPYGPQPKINYDRNPMFGGRPISIQENLGRDRTPATIVNGKLKLGTGSGKIKYGEAKPLYQDDLTERYYTQARQQVNNEAELKAFRAANGTSGGNDSKTFYQTKTVEKTNRHSQNRVAVKDEGEIRKKTRNVRAAAANTQQTSSLKGKKGRSKLRIGGADGLGSNSGGSGVTFS